MSREVYYEEEIDLRAIIHGLLKHIWVIVAVTLLFALAGYLLSTFVMEKLYQSTSYVMIVKPSTIVNFEAGIESSPQLPDAKSLTDLTLADDLVDKVYQNPQVESLFETPISLNTFKGKLTSILVGGSQFRLEVVDAQPERAAAIANIWAQEVTSRFNSLFGSGFTELEQIESQAEQTRQEWDTSEQLLLEFLAESNLEAWRIDLEQQKLSLAALVTKAEAIDVLISDAETLQLRLEKQPNSKTLSVEDALSLVTISQQASGTEESFQLQLNVEFIPVQETTVADARESVALLISALEQQREDLVTVISENSNMITELAARFESERYKSDQLTLQRDINRQAYNALSTHIVEVQILSANNDQIAKVAGQALPPIRPSSPKTLMNTAIAGGAGFMVSILFVLAWDWWRSPNKSE